jgi:hypothetical protein
VAYRMGSTEPRCGWSGMCWCISKNRFVYVSRIGGAQGIQCPKVVQGGNLANQPIQWAPRAHSSAIAPPYSSYKYHGALADKKCEESEV